MYACMHVWHARCSLLFIDPSTGKQDLTSSRSCKVRKQERKKERKKERRRSADDG
jgi:hypothetical protein